MFYRINNLWPRKGEYMFGIFPNIGLPELIIILIIACLLFGASQIPKLARALGKSAKEFKKGLHEDEETTEKTGEQETKNK
jgi:sec-independent protein translocase protein TatA